MPIDKVEVRTKHPRSKPTKAIYFSSLTLLMAAASGRVAARQQTTVAILATYAPHGGRWWPRSGGNCRVKERDPPAFK